jgi:hypothetical protein
MAMGPGEWARNCCSRRMSGEHIEARFRATVRFVGFKPSTLGRWQLRGQISLQRVIYPCARSAVERKQSRKFSDHWHRRARVARYDGDQHIGSIRSTVATCNSRPRRPIYSHGRHLHGENGTMASKIQISSQSTGQTAYCRPFLGPS